MLRLLAVAVLVAVSGFGWAQTVAAPQQPVPRAQAAGDLIDINTATAQQLRALPGFGDAYVRRVIAGRPYTAKNQMVTRGVLPQVVYEKVASRIIARHPGR